ncbi:sensor histidine kinase KdpD [Actinoplanes sp. N902-109]|uniref:sensor histidine kinase n=1 Tax=Actinoplanes sp. (strain N902-109) TaxID=649831 RepID=UPI0003294167|nr:ATP-binding protein [Actinoplanes sp. N902-109]AGL16554.1 ATP-binding region ATPase domain-containing protein [Actinoplanes sp. N902-109]
MVPITQLVAAVAVLGALLVAVRVARRAGARTGAHQLPVAAPRPVLTEAPSALAETRWELAKSQSALAVARVEIEELQECLRQAQLQPAATSPVPAAHSDGRHVEVFVNLSRRLQSLVHREIKLLDALENEVEDPDLLKGLFQVDHLATRIRRHAENLAVLGGTVSRRQWSRPIALTEVLRSAVAEVEHYSRVKLVPPIDGTLPGHAVSGVIHLIAELIENATMFAPPHTQVLLRAQRVAAGMAVEVEDRGLGLQRADLDRVNQLLVNPDDTNLDELLRDGRIGLYVVSMIAQQYGIVVQLQTNIYGGTQAVVILPPQLIGAAPDEPRAPGLTEPTLQLEIPQRAPLDDRVPLPQETALLPHAGRSHIEPRQVAVTTVAEPAVPATAARPPLPRRRRQTHMAPQLQLGPPPAAESPGEHQPGLMASFMSGVSQGQAAAPDPGSHG